VFVRWSCLFSVPQAPRQGTQMSSTWTIPLLATWTRLFAGPTLSAQTVEWMAASVLAAAMNHARRQVAVSSTQTATIAMCATRGAVTTQTATKMVVMVLDATTRLAMRVLAMQRDATSKGATQKGEFWRQPSLSFIATLLTHSYDVTM